MKHFSIFFSLGLTLCAACASHDVGQDCRTVGSTSECSTGICAADSIGRLVCEPTCKVYSDCGQSQDCVPVPNTSTMACRTR